MNGDRKFFIKLGIFILLLLWIGFLCAQKIDLATADLGRHLKNGEWMINSGFNFSEKHSPMYENFYSYTHPEFPAVNHHWGSGIIFYLIWKWTGFVGLSIFYIIATLAAFFLFFLLSVEESNFTLAALFSFFLAPLMAERTEIRPEVFSVLFLVVFFFVLWKYLRKEISWKWLFILPVIMVFWVNLHVYFFLGFFLIGIFGLEKLIKGETKEIKKIGSMFVLAVLAALLNPAGFRGLVYPLFIFKNYQYTIVENKSVWFVENYGILNSNFIIIKAVLVLIILSFILLFFINRKKISISLLIIALLFGALGWLAIRNFTLLGFFAFPVLSYNFYHIFKQKEGEMNYAKENGIAVLYIILAVLSFYGNIQYAWAHSQESGIGLRLGVEDAANFIRKEGIVGPFFNNYDLGGYLIWEMFPREKVFVDNRPEEYPGEFFTNVYKPMQESKEIWNKEELKWNFNAIVFYWRDITPWGQGFLKNIKTNENWAQVYKDDYTMIYLRKNKANQLIIDKYKQ